MCLAFTFKYLIPNVMELSSIPPPLSLRLLLDFSEHSIYKITK